MKFLLVLAIIGVLRFTNGASVSVKPSAVHAILTGEMLENGIIDWDKIARPRTLSHSTDAKKNDNTVDNYKDTLENVDKHANEVLSFRDLKSEKSSCVLECVRHIASCLITSYESVYTPITVSNPGDYNKESEIEMHNEEFHEWYRSQISSEELTGVPAFAHCLVNAVTDFGLCSIPERTATSKTPRRLISMYVDSEDFPSLDPYWNIETAEDGQF